MIKTGLWLELEAAIGFLVGLGLGSLLGQRTVAVILMIVPRGRVDTDRASRDGSAFRDLQRAVVGVATAHLEPGQLPSAFGGGGSDYRVTESTATAVCVILAWLIGWTALGAWRMATRAPNQHASASSSHGRPRTPITRYRIAARPTR